MGGGRLWASSKLFCAASVRLAVVCCLTAAFHVRATSQRQAQAIVRADLPPLLARVPQCRKTLMDAGECGWWQHNYTALHTDTVAGKKYYSSALLPLRRPDTLSHLNQ